MTETGSEIEVLPPRRPMQSEAIGQLMAHAEAMTAAKQLGDALASTDMVPKDYKNKPGNAAAAILYGAELGLNPIQSLQQIFIVHGAPAIYARTAVALVKRHGVIVETVASDTESVTVRASDPRTAQVEESTWDIGRATLAGYTVNDRYKTNPQEMLYAKAAMDVCRKIAPDILLGIPYAREELELEQQPRRVSSERDSRGVAALRERAQSAQKLTQNQIDAAAATSRSHTEPEPVDEEVKRQRIANTRKLFAILNDCGLADKDSRDDRLIILSHYAQRPIESTNDLTDDELRVITNTLAPLDKQGTVDAALTEILNAATLAEDNTARKNNDEGTP